jgi:hypothetical protein
VWIAGCGPLPLLYATQFLRAGGNLAGYLDTTPVGQWRSALRFLPGALHGVGDIFKGLQWNAALKRSGALVIGGVTDIRAKGQGLIEALEYRTASGATAIVDATTLLVHEGVIPHIHAALSLDCDFEWNPAQDCFVPKLDEWGETSKDNLFVAGDGAGIGGAKAALLRGELAAIAIASRLGGLDHAQATAAARPLRRKLHRELAMRPFLDALFKPRQQVFAPADDTIVCRCEEVTAGEVRRLANVGRPGPSQMKTATRVGMGPCQGRQCGYTVTRILAECQSRTPSDVGFFHVRPPLKPISIGELASLDGSTPA